MVEMVQVPVGDLRLPGEIGVQESDLLDRMPDGKLEEDSATEKVRLVSLGCFCGPKLSFKKIGRGSETLPFDWLRTRIDGLLHFMRNDYEGFYDWTTQQQVGDTSMNIYRGYYHSFWHDNPTDPAMHERYDRRIQRFKEIDATSSTVVFVRALASSDELAKCPELLKELKLRHGPNACLLVIVDFQTTAQGAALIKGHSDLLVYYLTGDVHIDGDGAPYCEPVRVGLDWAVGRPIKAMVFDSFEIIINCVDETNWGMTGLENVPAFEDEPRPATKDGEEEAPRWVEKIPGKPSPPQHQEARPEPVVEPSPEPSPSGPANNVESDLLETFGATSHKAVNDVVLVSLGCFCGPKLTFQKMGRGAETLPFDWVRTSFDGLLHFIRTDFEGYFNYKTKRSVPNSKMVMYRSHLHSFWHDNPDAPEMQEKYRRRIARFGALKDSERPILFVRAVSSMDELRWADELLDALKEGFGEKACLLLIADFQRSTLGAIFVEDVEDIIVYFMCSADRGSGAEAMAPYSTPVQIAIDWVNGEALEAGCVASLAELWALADNVSGNNLADFGEFQAFEPLSADDDAAASLTQVASKGFKTSGACDGFGDEGDAKQHTTDRTPRGGLCHNGVWKLLRRALGCK
mmetsp:Transcript_75885/g.210598  ORF Transcript_75885/g.210598 Transcript_75885/m.210598 type:complete len:630 (+) Transcript_75885:82-1971(+)|eukprot:CAMPEP_0117514012 /NCGR_PEP_ID=MMETSP0784-20121206/29851_1 /TAXON_ID=39447 /ORGANISM="" /LENGTH=629 /DNA_ID=CAMNT_0005309797 /DNA_START=82 /DNA_END=1971 /DNA_ORIENTATION=+